MRYLLVFDSSRSVSVSRQRGGGRGCGSGNLGICLWGINCISKLFAV